MFGKNKLCPSLNLIKKNTRILQGINRHLNTHHRLLLKNTKSFSTSDKIDDNQQQDDLILKEKLIKMSLLNVNKYGWTENSIKIAANELGYSHNLSSLLNNGPMDLIYYTMDNWNEKLKKDIEAIKADKHLSLDDMYKKAFKLRLSYEIPLITTWPSAIKQGMSVKNLPTTLEKLIDTVNIMASIEEGNHLNRNDDVEYKAVPLTKKYLLLKTLIVTEIHMMTDRSNNFSNTWDFMEKFYHFNFAIYSSLEKFSLINSSVLSMIKYSLISLAPYDFSQVDQILRKKFEMEQDDAVKL